MSVCRACTFAEVDGSWYLLLEDEDSPKNAWSWTDHAQGYGPFNSFDTAEEYLSDYFSNPGGYNQSEGLKLADMPKDSGIRKLIENAKRPKRYGPWN